MKRNALCAPHTADEGGMFQVRSTVKGRFVDPLDEQRSLTLEQARSALALYREAIRAMGGTIFHEVPRGYLIAETAWGVETVGIYASAPPDED